MERREGVHPDLIPETGDRRKRPSRIPFFRRFADTRRVVKYAVGGLAVAAFLAIGFWALATTTDENTRDIEANRRLARVVCVESNKLRDGERALWQRIAELSNQNPDPRIPKAERERRLREFLAFVNKTFAHVDCDAPQAVGGSGLPPAVSFPVVTRVETNTVTKTRTVFVTVPGGTRVRIVCQLPNGRPCP